MHTMAMRGEYHAPDLDSELFPGQQYGHILFDDVLGGWFALDRLMIIRIVMTVIMAVFFAIAMRNPKLVPRGVQNVAEMGLDFVRVNIAEEILGRKEGRRFLPILATIFFLVLVMNIPAIIPGMNISPNARIGMPIVLAAAAYVVMIYAGARRYGFFKFIKSSVVVPNIPGALHIMMVPIEFFSTFVLRPITLTLRLMANFLAGHMILVVAFAATNFFFWQLNAWSVVSVATIVGAILFTLFECIIIFLQAYIFALLTAVYIDLSLHADSH